MNYLIKKQDLIEEAAFYGDVNINEDWFLSQEEIDFDEASQGFIDDGGNDIIFKEDKIDEFSFEEQKQKDILLDCSIQPNLEMYNKCMILEYWSGVKTKLQKYMNTKN